MLKKYTKDIDLNIYLAVAEELGLHNEVVDPRTGFITITDGKKRVNFKGTSPSWNGLAEFHLSRDKFATSQLLARHNVPVPEGELFPREKIEELFIFARKNFPVVVKPNNGSQGNCVFMDISNENELQHAVSEVLKSSAKNILVERCYIGKDYRILVFDGIVYDVVERIPAYVVGNGKHDITALITAKNEKRDKIFQDCCIKVDGATQHTLAQYGYKLDSVIKKGESVTVRRNCNLSTGGEVERVPIKNVHPDNLALFSLVQQTIGLTQAGLDLITPDISISYKENNAVINEVNGTIGIDIHYFASSPPDTAPIKMMFRKFFGLPE